MRGYSIRGAWLLAACVALLPASARGQSPDDAGVQLFAVWPNDSTGPSGSEVVFEEPPPYVARGQAGGSPGYAPAHPQLPVPLGSTRPEDGGPYVWAQGLLYRQTNPLRNQPIAVRGFQASDSSLGLVPGTFVGSGRPALDVQNVNGQVGYQPGLELGAGWKFRDGSALSISWLNLTTAKYTHGVTSAAPNNSVGINLADSFLFSPVFNFPPEFSGPPNRITPQTINFFNPLPPPVPQINPGVQRTPSEFAAYGIWNAASIMTIEFRQRFQQWDIMYREPIYETDDYRLSGIVGPRFAWFWERFKWRTTSIGQDLDGFISDTSPDNVAVYTNITSNRMYGAFTGCEQEFYMGHGFACHIKTEVALFMNSVKERAKYETENRFAGRPENKRAKREWTVVPGFNAAAGLMWYPTEFVQIFAGYEFLSFLNTLASRRPVDFDYSNLNPKWSSFSRCMDGFWINLAIRF
jgi:hypothetical protein